MHKTVVGSTMDGPETYTRVSKVYARKHWQDERIDICPVNLCPGGGFRPNMTMFHHEGFEQKIWIAMSEFDYIVQEFTAYNCTCRETGYYPAFYKVA